jgi:hypothetical protein
MTQHSFALIPFPDSTVPKMMITGGMTRAQNLLSVQYVLTGSIDEILFPFPVPHPGRRDELWLSTCFEFFLAITDQPQYWEFNLSPSGEWNVFRMDAYRRIGFREEDLIQDLQTEFNRDMDRVRLDASVDLSPIVEPETDLQAGITSVIQTRDGHETFWALAHPNLQADFHVRESFTLVLEGTDPP